VKYIFKKNICKWAQLCLLPAGEKKIIKHTDVLASSTSAATHPPSEAMADAESAIF
jgi:hypothetical protein